MSSYRSGDIVDVVIVGAGYAGLIAARTIAENSPTGSKILLLEARDRVGGRAFTARYHDMSIDLGAEWFHPEFHPHVANEVERYGASFLPESMSTKDGGCKYLWSDELTCCGADLPVPEDHKEEFSRIMNRLSTDANALRGSCMDWKRFDISYLEYVDSILNAKGPTREFILAQGFTHSGAKAEDVSAVAILHDILLFGSAEVAFCGSLSRIDCGAGTLAERMMDDLVSTYGVEIQFNSAVSSVTTAASSATAWLKNGTRIECSYVVLSVPLNVLGSIDFCPDIDDSFLIASSELNSGGCYKYWVEFEPTPAGTFERTLGWSSCSIIESYTRSDSSGHCVCTCFSSQDYTTTPSSLVSELYLLYEKESKCDNIKQVIYHDWKKDHYSKGTWLTIRPGMAELYFDIRKKLFTPLSESNLLKTRVVISGGDFSEHWFGWVEGAIESGIAAGNYVISQSR